MRHFARGKTQVIRQFLPNGALNTWPSYHSVRYSTLMSDTKAGLISAWMNDTHRHSIRIHSFTESNKAAVNEGLTV